jgi:hypothetical protein
MNVICKCKASRSQRARKMCNRLSIESEGIFIRRVKSGHRHDSELSKGFRLASKYRRDRDELYWASNEQLVIPDHDWLREECVHSVQAHSHVGHYWINRMSKKAMEIHFWPGMGSTGKTYVRECVSCNCQRVQCVRQRPQWEVHPLQISERRWHAMAVHLDGSYYRFTCHQTGL